ncbi:beta-lactamase domain protein [Magnetococcus marinus MC-1]|uniref:Ribonuclease J n=1 Tax=Magnetococcus marinus (strain ATCC BAA-1437 / JCM 17883 / MC-1) TaxID=156889 RepID=A0L832_MAGMM|nr:ribonuclease J [Magnetococcus marinus]ABK44125.1 beta-lactamase domain protein [Magnetococcus marinus MC-1]
MTSSTEGSVRILPLGGLGEIGMNLMVYECQGKLLVFDTGLTFPSPDTPGVDVIIPDIRWLEERKQDVVGIILTHGHEDHIGALPYVWPRLESPIFGTAFTLGLVKMKFKEHDLSTATIREVRHREAFQVGPFNLIFIHVTHSIVDASAVAIRTPIGTLLHSGDFKFDHTPVNGLTSDLFSLAKLGEEGVLALLSDSTNVDRSGSSRSESSVRPALDEQMARAQGLVVCATFSSNIHRIQQIVDSAIAHGRKVVLNGRSMEANVGVARELGFIRLDGDDLVTVKSIKNHERHRLCIISTGSQGEPNSSLMRIAHQEHRDIILGAGDMVILSSKFIPGNERAIWSLINLLYERGVEVVHEKDNPHIHVSGHAPADDLKTMLALTKPRFFIPMHGEPRHLHLHRKLALAMGVAEERSLVMENGDLVELTPNHISIIDRVEHGRVFVDGKGVGDICDIVMRDRRHLSEDGMVVVVMVVAKDGGQLLEGPEILTRGVIHEDENPQMLEEMRETVAQALAIGAKGMDFNEDEQVGASDIAVRALRRFFKKRLGRRPVVLPMVMEM